MKHVTLYYVMRMRSVPCSTVASGNVIVNVTVTIIIKRLALKSQYFRRNVHDIREYMYLGYMKNSSKRMIFCLLLLPLRILNWASTNLCISCVAVNSSFELLRS